MSLITPSNRPPCPPQTRAQRTWLAQEWRHWAEIPPLPLTVLLLSTTLFVYLAPLLPIAAYLLWLWASSSWSWRDRWSSILVWAKQGSGLVAFLIGIVALGTAHIWIIPRLLIAAQAFWKAHLLGDLSLSPLDLDALLARTLLLLPLAPLLALCYEWLDPRTCMQPRRILTPADLTEPQPAADTSILPSLGTHKESSLRLQTSAKAAPASGTLRQPRPRRHCPSPPQITSERDLTSDTVQDTGSSPSPRKNGLSVSPESPAETHPPASAAIDWDDLAE